MLQENIFALGIHLKIKLCTVIYFHSSEILFSYFLCVICFCCCFNLDITFSTADNQIPLVTNFPENSSLPERCRHCSILEHSGRWQIGHTNEQCIPLRGEGGIDPHFKASPAQKCFLSNSLLNYCLFLNEICYIFLSFRGKVLWISAIKNLMSRYNISSVMWFNSESRTSWQASRYCEIRNCWMVLLFALM